MIKGYVLKALSRFFFKSAKAGNQPLDAIQMELENLNTTRIVVNPFQVLCQDFATAVQK